LFVTTESTQFFKTPVRHRYSLSEEAIVVSATFVFMTYSCSFVLLQNNKTANKVRKNCMSEKTKQKPVQIAARKRKTTATKRSQRVVRDKQ